MYYPPEHRIRMLIVVRPPSAKTGQTGIVQCKGLTKLGNIVAETSLQTQTFPSLAARETSVADANFASWKQGNVSESRQKHFCFTNASFASETYVSQFSHPMKHVWKQCFRNKVSYFSQALIPWHISCVLLPLYRKMT